MKRFFLVTFAALACTSVQSVKSPGTYVASRQPRVVWLTRADHGVVRMSGPRMVGDTIVGAVNGQYTEVPMSDVTAMKAIVTDKGRTIALAAVGGVATVAALVVIFSHGGSGAQLPESDSSPVTGRYKY